MATPVWIEYGERATGDNDPVYGANGIVNRPAKDIWTNFTAEHSTDGAHTYSALAALLIPTGTIWETALRTAPTGWLLLGDGAAVSRSTYAALFEAIVPSLGTMTVTIATPGVITLNSHGFVAGDTFYVTTTGALPTGMSANTLYYVIAGGLGANSFQFSATSGGAAINTTGSQSGIHTLRACPYGIGDGSTTFNLPNISGRSPMGSGRGSGLTARTLGTTLGEENHANTANENGPHKHTLRGRATTAGSSYITSQGSNTVDTLAAASMDNSGLGTPHNTVHPVFVVNYIIKT